MEYIQGAFAKFGELQWYTIAVIILITLFALAMYISGKKVKWNARMLANAAMCIAISFLLSYIRLYRMPQGGSITPASMLPIVMFTMAYGTLPGMVVGAAYGLIGLIQEPYIIHPIQMLLDYPLASAMLGLAGLVRRMPKSVYRLPLGVLIAGVGKYVCAVISGTVFFADYAGDMNPLIYSLVYNVSYLGPDTLFAMAVAAIPQISALENVMRGSKRT